MQDQVAYRPDRTLGLIFLSLSFLLIVGVSLFGLWHASQTSISPAFLPIALIIAVAGPLLAYRIYSLQSAVFILMREGIRLRWGLRIEDIPINDVLWIHPAAELSSPLPLPWLRFPGAILGKRNLHGGGSIEYLASSIKNLVFISTSTGGFAISPEDPDAFIQTYYRFIEMGSLSPIAARSVYPAFLLRRVWEALPARILLLGSIILSLLLLFWVSLIIPSRNEVHMGFRPDGSPGDILPVERLLLLPLLNFFFLMIGLVAGVFFYRREVSKTISYVLWSAGLASVIFFLLAVFFIFQLGS